MGIRIIENLLIIYYLFYFLIDWIFFIIFLFKIKRENSKIASNAHFAKYPVSVLVPAYNEEVTLVDSVKLVLMGSRLFVKIWKSWFVYGDIFMMPVKRQKLFFCLILFAGRKFRIIPDFC